LGSKKDSSYAQVLYRLGYAHEFGMKDRRAAVKYYEEALSIQQKTIPNHADCVQTMLALANIYKEDGRLKDAEPLYLKAIEVGKDALGATNTTYAEALNNLALLYKDLGRNYEAIPLFLKAKNIYKEVAGEQGSDYAEVLNNLASSFKAIGNLEKAEALYLKTKKDNIKKENKKFVKK